MTKKRLKQCNQPMDDCHQYIAKGIDVSSNQGKIDFSRLADSGLEFIMIRCGYGSNLDSQDDWYFERNVEECEKHHIPWGTYFYSYATNLTEAKNELQHILRLLKDKKPLYPVFIDMEDTDEYKKKRDVSDRMCADICMFLCEQLRQFGYCSGIFSNLYWLTYRINSPKLNQFERWLIQWAPQATYPQKFQIWQSSSRGKAEGISGWVNLNVCYKDYPRLIKEEGLNGYPKPRASTLPTAYPFQVGDVVRIKRGKRSCGGKKFSRAVHRGRYVIDSCRSDTATLDRLGINTDFYLSDLLQTNERQGSAFRWYTVKPDETLRKIAAQQMGSGWQLFRLSRYNGLKIRTKLFRGQQLKIPK